jgi:glutamine synthetase
MFHKLEYIWLDGHETSNIRSKTRILESNKEEVTLEDCKEWSFDGSSTEQATGDKSDCILSPVKIVKDPTRKGSSFLVVCEVMNADGSPHKTNYRAKLREVIEEYGDHEALFGFEQEYTLLNLTNGRPLGFPESINHFAKPQGEFYCGVGADQVKARGLVERHLDICLEAGLKVSGINAEVMIGQWEYQIGPLGALDVSDQIIISRYFLYKVSEKYNVGVTIHPKPVHGDWNGSGCHINFSTKETMADGGLEVIEFICERLGKTHDEHIAEYGSNNDERLVKKLETSSIDEFTYGVSDRGCSVRIPLETHKQGKGYFEDRRPASNVEPYRACGRILKSVGQILVDVYPLAHF